MNTATETKQVPETLLEAIRYFSDPDVSLEFVTNLRWPDGVTCPRLLADGTPCGSKEVSFLSTRRIWK